MKKATLNLLKNKDNPIRYIESFALPFKYIENDTHYINPMTNPLCFLDFIHGSCGYKINLSHIVALRQLVHNQNVLLQVPEYTHSSQFVCVYSLFLLLTKNGYVIIHRYLYLIFLLFTSMQSYITTISLSLSSGTSSLK